MAINRRDFLKVTAGSGLLLASGVSPAMAKKPLSPDAVGFLYDATLCIGCKSCMVNCKKYNSVPGGALYEPGRTIPYERMSADEIYDAPVELSAKSLSIIKAYKNGTGMEQNAVENGFSFVKNNCMHCLDPACVSVCPVGALLKEPGSGAVTYDQDKCIGCRYCQVACPFGVPKFQWESTSPKIVKCQLCHHRYKDGGIAACCEFCPTGASIFGSVTALRAEAKRRLALKFGSDYDYPTNTVGSSNRVAKKVSKYLDHVYGLSEAGGTQYLLLAGVPFDLLGFNPEISDQAYPDLTWDYIRKLPVLIGVLLAGGAASYYYNRDRKGAGDE
jgi:Fe-S-cluster-containing dehydrogenase component